MQDVIDMQSIDLNKDILWTKWIEVAGLKIIYKGFFKSFIVSYADRMCPEHHFVENCIENFPSV